MSTTASCCLMMAEKDLRLLVDGRETMEWPYCWVTLGLRRVQCWMFRLASRCECGTGGPAGRQLPFQDRQRYARVQPLHHQLPLRQLPHHLGSAPHLQVNMYVVSSTQVRCRYYNGSSPPGIRHPPPASVPGIKADVSPSSPATRR